MTILENKVKINIKNNITYNIEWQPTGHVVFNSSTVVEAYLQRVPR